MLPRSCSHPNGTHAVPRVRIAEHHAQDARSLRVSAPQQGPDGVGPGAVVAAGEKVMQPVAARRSNRVRASSALAPLEASLLNTVGIKHLPVGDNLSVTPTY